MPTVVLECSQCHKHYGVDKLQTYNGFSCSKCNHSYYWINKKDPFVRVCKGCRHIESVTANTLFHKVKFSLRKAFLIIFEMSTTTKGCSSPVLARKYGINQKTAWLFMFKVRKAMASSEQYPLEGNCEVDEIMIGGHRRGKPGRGAQNKKKVSVVVDKDHKGGIQRAYAVRIEDFSTQQLVKIFDRQHGPVLRTNLVFGICILGFRQPIQLPLTLHPMPSSKSTIHPGGG